MYTRRYSLALVALAAAASPVAAQNASASSSAAGSSASAGSAGSGFNGDASGNPGTNPMIPTSISPTCQSFLARLNSNTAVAQCTAPLINATTLFASGTVDDADKGQVQAALDGLCGFKAQGCSDLLVRQVLGHFAGNCSQELQGGQPEVMSSYDVLYALNPFKKAICTKSDDGSYCLSIIASGASSAGNSSSESVSSPALNTSSTASTKGPNNIVNDYATPSAPSFQDVLSAAAQGLVMQWSTPVKRGLSLVARGTNYTSTSNGNSTSSAYNSTSSANSTSSSNATSTGSAPSASTSSTPALLPNSTTYLTTSLPFLFLSPSYPSPVLCSNCTISILASYVAFEQSLPYAAGQGLGSSGLLQGQIGLWKGVGGKCGTQFLGQVQKVAGQQAAMSGAVGNGVKTVAAAAAVLLASVFVTFA